MLINFLFLKKKKIEHLCSCGKKGIRCELLITEGNNRFSFKNKKFINEVKSINVPEE